MKWIFSLCYTYTWVRQMRLNHNQPSIIWWFPEIGVPQNHPFLDGIFPKINHPAMKGYPHLRKPPYYHTWLGLPRPSTSKEVHQQGMACTDPSWGLGVPCLKEDRRLWLFKMTSQSLCLLTHTYIHGCNITVSRRTCLISSIWSRAIPFM